MQLDRLVCRNFRCLSDTQFQPASGVNVIRGRNAQGKTSVLEAILFACTGRSHRTTRDEELVRYGQDAFEIRLEAARAGRSVVIDARWWKGAKRLKVNDVPVPRLSDLLGRVHVVLFAPEDIELVKGGAAARRRFMDAALAQLRPAYLDALQVYRQCLRQRNELLRRSRPDPAHLATWEGQLAVHGAVLMRHRAGYVQQLAAHASGAYRSIAGDESLSIAYAPDIEDPDSIARALEARRASDIRRGQTTHGPHRDELNISIGGAAARNFGSQGQQKSAAVALRLAELLNAADHLGEYPILMLDEVLAELDADRTKRLLSSLPDPVQCLLTTTDVAGAHLTSAADRSFYIDGGFISQAEGDRNARGSSEERQPNPEYT